MRREWILLTTYGWYWKRFTRRDRSRIPPELKKIGVYIHVFPGNPSRIIYVGTAIGQNGFHGRLRNEVSEYFNKLGLVFRARVTEDIYKKGMTISPSETIERYIEATLKPMGGMRGSMTIWVPETKALSQNYFLREDENLWQDQGWKTFVEKEHLDIEIFGLELPASETQMVETRLQIAIGEQFDIGFYRVSDQNWLGRQHKRLELERMVRKDRLSSLEPLHIDVSQLRAAKLNEEDLRPLNDPENKNLILRHFDKLIAD